MPGCMKHKLERGREACRERCPGPGSVADKSQWVDWTISLRKPKCEYLKIPSSPARLANVIGVPTSFCQQGERMLLKPHQRQF